jgi:hypothetical protein
MPEPDPGLGVHLRKFLLEMFPSGSVGAEVGVHRGDFSRAILDTVAPARLHLIDPWHHEPSPTYDLALYGGRAKDGQAEMDARYEQVLARFAPEIEAGQITVHRAPSADALRSLPDESLDWVYIDGNHLYEYVAVDLELGFAKTRPGGLVTGDDYRDGGWWEGGVKRAVDEVAERGTARLLLVRDGQFVFEKPGSA